MQKPVLEVQHLTKKFDNFTAVNDISFSVAEGEIVGFLGPNGAGKTTTINMILSLINPTSGNITMFQKSLDKHRSACLQMSNSAASYTCVPWRLTVREYLYVFSLLYSVENPKERIESLVKRFELEEIVAKRGEELSSGQTTRVVLAKAFINNPRLVLLDEPTASLDPDVANKVRSYIQSTQKNHNTAMLFTSHNMAEVTQVCDRVVFINKGKIIAEDTPEELARRIQKSKIRLMIIDGMKRTVRYCNKERSSYEQDGRYITVTIHEREIASFLTKLARKGIEYDEISIEKPTLEDFFLHVTDGETS